MSELKRPTREELYPRPTADEIRQKADELLSGDPKNAAGWIKALNIMNKKEEMSAGQLREAGLVNWMEKDITTGQFAGYDVEDLNELRDQLLAKQQETES